MSKLQKSAWVNIVALTVAGLFSMLCFLLASSRIEKRFNYIAVIIFLMCISLACPIALIFHKKKSYTAGFDERERLIEQKANTLSISGLLLFLNLACFIPLLGFGAGSVIKTIYLPIVFWGTIFTHQLIKSAAIIIQCSMEDANG